MREDMKRKLVFGLTIQVLVLIISGVSSIMHKAFKCKLLHFYRTRLALGS